MFTRFVLFLVSAMLLAGCAGQSFFIVAQDPNNPYSFIQIAGRVPTQPTLCVKDEGDIYRISCQTGQLNMRKFDGNRQYTCVQQNGTTINPAKAWLPHPDRNQCPRGIVDQKNGNQFGGGGGQCVPAPQIPGVYGQPQYWGNC